MNRSARDAATRFLQRFVRGEVAGSAVLADWPEAGGDAGLEFTAGEVRGIVEAYGGGCIDVSEDNAQALGDRLTLCDSIAFLQSDQGEPQNSVECEAFFTAHSPLRQAPWLSPGADRFVDIEAARRWCVILRRPFVVRSQALLRGFLAGGSLANLDPLPTPEGFALPAENREVSHALHEFLNSLSRKPSRKLRHKSHQRYRLDLISDATLRRTAERGVERLIVFLEQGTAYPGDYFDRGKYSLLSCFLGIVTFIGVLLASRTWGRQLQVPPGWRINTISVGSATFVTISVGALLARLNRAWFRRSLVRGPYRFWPFRNEKEFLEAGSGSYTRA